MGTPMIERADETVLAVARARIAQAILGASPHPVPDQLGAIALRPRQTDAVKRLRSLLRQHAGAMLADPVGLGKTFVALAVASEFRTVVVVAPAALREMWQGASERAGCSITFVTTQ